MYVRRIGECHAVRRIIVPVAVKGRRSVTVAGALMGGAFFTVFVVPVCASSGWLYHGLDQR